MISWLSLVGVPGFLLDQEGTGVVGPDPGSAAPVRDIPLPGLSSRVGLGLANPAPSAGARRGSRGCEEAGAGDACEEEAAEAGAGAEEI